MNEAKHFLNSSVDLDSVFSGKQSPTPTPNPDLRQLQSHIVTMSKQVEQLTETTRHLLHRPREKSGLPWNLITSIGFGVITVGIAASLILQKHIHSLETEWKTMLQQELSQAEQKTKERELALDTAIQTLKANSEKQKEYMLDKMNETSSLLFTQRDRLNQLEGQALAQNQRLLEMGRYISPAPSSKAAPDPVYQQLEQKLNRWQEQQPPIVVAEPDAVSSPPPAPAQDFQSEKNRRYASAYTKIGWTESQNGNWNKAIQAYQNAVKLDPTSGTAHYNLACLFAKTGRMTESLRQLKAGRPFFTPDLIAAAQRDQDLDSLRNDPYFQSLMRVI